MVSNLTKSRDPRSSGSQDDTYRTGFTPNSINQLNTLTDPLNRNISNTYDRTGNLTRISLPNGLEINYTYDNANRLTRKDLDGGRYFNYTYDGANELTSVVDHDNRTYAWDYDGAHRLKNTTDTFNHRLDYQWDKSSNLTTLTGTGAGNVSYQYGSDNRFLSLTLPDASNISYHYDESGRVFQIRYPGSYNYRNTGYLPNGWCSTIQDNAFPNHVKYYYEYYDNGNIRTISSWAGTEYYEYDANGRLTKWRHDSNPDTNYQYDAAGNLITKGSATFTYNNANQITNTDYTYDNNGNLTGDGTYRYTYDAENQLIETRRASDNNLIAVYSYNHDGSRRSKTIYSGQTSQTTNFHWDSFGHLVRESDSGGTTLANYYCDANGKIVGLKKNNQTYLYHDNLRGDIVSVTDTNNNIQAQYNYDPWGTQTSYPGTLTQPFRYAGYYYDEETGLYYCKSRYYSPALGRFLTKDSIGYIDYSDPQTLNLYSYCGNNPINRTDPNGNLDYDENGGDDKTILKDILGDDIDKIHEQQEIWKNAAPGSRERADAHDKAIQIRKDAVARFESGSNSDYSEFVHTAHYVETSSTVTGFGWLMLEASGSPALTGGSSAAATALATGGSVFFTAGGVLVIFPLAKWQAPYMYEYYQQYGEFPIVQ